MIKTMFDSHSGQLCKNFVCINLLNIQFKTFQLLQSSFNKIKLFLKSICILKPKKIFLDNDKINFNKSTCKIHLLKQDQLREDFYEKFEKFLEFR